MLFGETPANFQTAVCYFDFVTSMMLNLANTPQAKASFLLLVNEAKP
jgi:hypothetical protein